MAPRNDITEAQRARSIHALCALGVSVMLVFYCAQSLTNGVVYKGGEGVVWQRDSYDCGAAALQMVFTHFSIASDYDDLLLRLEISPGGTSMLRLKHAAEAKGLRCSGWRLTTRDLPDIPLPAILFMRKNHFVVLDTFNPAGTIIIRDPARGRLQLTLQKLESIWRGESLLFYRPGSTGNSRWFEPPRISVHKPLTMTLAPRVASGARLFRELENELGLFEVEGDVGGCPFAGRSFFGQRIRSDLSGSLCCDKPPLRYPVPYSGSDPDRVDARADDCGERPAWGGRLQHSNHAALVRRRGNRHSTITDGARAGARAINLVNGAGVSDPPGLFSDADRRVLRLHSCPLA